MLYESLVCRTPVFFNKVKLFLKTSGHTQVAHENPLMWSLFLSDLVCALRRKCLVCCVIRYRRRLKDVSFPIPVVGPTFYGVLERNSDIKVSCILTLSVVSYPLEGKTSLPLIPPLTYFGGFCENGEDD